MLELLVGSQLSSILCLGAHCDDIEIGCGGTILKLLERNHTLSVQWIVLCSTDVRAREAEESAALFLQDAADRRVIINAYEERYLPYQATTIKRYFDELGRNIRPDLVFTHQREDLHQDHKLISELSWNTFRDHMILEYEVPKYDGDIGRPNAFVHLDAEVCNRKINHLKQAFASQQEKHWFSEETFRALLRLRGLESKAPSGYAEAFYARKMVFG